MLKPPNECVVAAVRAGIFEIFNLNLHKALDSLALRHALDDDDLAKLVTDTAMIVETYKPHQEITLVYICRIRMRIYVIKSLNDIYMSNNF